MKTLKRVLGLTVFGMLLVGARLDAQEQPAPVAPEPDQPAPAAAQNQPADPPVGQETFPPESPPPIPAGQPPAQPPADPQPPVQPPYSPQPVRPGVVTEIVPPEDPFLPPDGMATPPDCLIDLLGFYGHHPFVYSDRNCFDLASAAYRYGYFLDAIALLSHAIEQYPQAHYYYLRGMAQMKAGLAHDAIASADGVLDAIAAGNYGGLDKVSERFNGPLGKQFQELLDLRRAAR
jgi:tetratricopeptide (TPR) repeat protein